MTIQVVLLHEKAEYFHGCQIMAAAVVMERVLFDIVKKIVVPVKDSSKIDKTDRIDGGGFADDIVVDVMVLVQE